ncbi:hypothetical protein C1H46_009599 [Malus baccata]|uniref:Alliinase C-terminal domain-containing protein n=1 Tax=Malus baccata TaxID=106549 RepID=A0A540N121_MALBA|nr:hypothetical protein C1H46_009599 [Malus baccata]
MATAGEILKRNLTESFYLSGDSPNNLDGKLNKAVLHGPNFSTIYDRVYYWPHFTAIPTSADTDGDTKKSKDDITVHCQ